MVTTSILNLTFAFTIVYRMGYFTQYHLSNLNRLNKICQDIFPFGPKQYSCLLFLGFLALDWWSVEAYVSCTDGTVCVTITLKKTERFRVGMKKPSKALEKLALRRLELYS